MNLDLNGKSILITGGTGSFGKEFTKIVLERWPGIKRLVIYSRDEQKQYQMAFEFPEARYPCIRFFYWRCTRFGTFKKSMPRY